MLAKKYVRKLTKAPVMVQPKFNGYRSLVTHGDSWTRLTNDHNKVLQLNLFRSLQMEMPEGIVFDGEIYAHGYKLQDIISLGKNWQLESSMLRYHVYDCLLLEDKTAVFKDRWAVLSQWFKDNDHPNAVLSPCNLLLELDLVSEACSMWVNKGFEGLIIRDPDSIYKFGRYGRRLQKKKLWQDAEWRILNVTEGTGKSEGSPIFHCKSKNGTPFKVTMSNGSYEYRNKHWMGRKSLVGKLLTVTYQDITKDFVPTPVRECIVRDYD